MKACPVCSHTSIDANFCYKDGSPMQGFSACPECGKTVGPFDRFCENCGTRIVPDAPDPHDEAVETALIEERKARSEVS